MAKLYVVTEHPHLWRYFKAMVKMSQGTKERLSLVINACRYLFHWGFIPTVLYLGL